MKLKTKNNILFIFHEICLYLIPLIIIIGIITTSYNYISCMGIDPRFNPNSISCDGLALVLSIPYIIIAFVLIITYIIVRFYYKKTKNQIKNDFLNTVDKIKTKHSKNIANTFNSKKK